MDFAINAKPSQVYVPEDKTTFSYKIWSLCVSAPFEYFVLVLITINTVILMMKVGICCILFFKIKIHFKKLLLLFSGIINKNQ